MTKLTKFLIAALLLFVNLSCGGSTSVEKETDDLPTDNTASDAGTDSGNSNSDSDSDTTNTPAICDNDANSFTVNLSQLNPTNLTNQPSQQLRIQATHDIDLIAYLIKESNSLPEASDASWSTINATTALDLNITYTIASGDGDKNIFLFVKDSCNRVSAASNSLAITLDTTPPTGLLTLNNGDKFTLATNSNISGHLVAQDNQSGITKYIFSYSTTIPAFHDSNWVDIPPNTTLDLTKNFLLPAPLNQKKYVNVWLKDAAGNISNAISAGIEIMRFTPYQIGQYGAYPSLAINPYDQPYLVAYTELSRGIVAFTIINDTFYLIDFHDVNDPSDLTDATGTFASMKIDSNNFAHIAYRDETHNKLKYARVDLNKPINSYLDQTVETLTIGGISASLGVTSNGTIYIAHQIYDDVDGNAFNFAKKVNGVWSFNLLKNIYTIPDDQESSLALDMDEKPHIAISENYSHIVEFTPNANNFIETSLENTSVAYPSIAISKNNNDEFIAYNTAFNIRLASRINFDWTIEDLDTTRGFAGVKTALDSADNLYVFYSEPDVNTLTCAIKSNGNWTYYPIDNDVLTFDFSNVIKGTNFDIAIDSNDRIHLVYYDVVNHRLTYGTTADAE